MIVFLIQFNWKYVYVIELLHPQDWGDINRKVIFMDATTITTKKSKNYTKPQKHPHV